ncbi:MAG TPA: hypothetical protein VGE74_25875 [Gemmata sp.]
MKLLSLVAAALVLAVAGGEVRAQCGAACPPAQVQQLKVQQATYAAPVVVAQPLVVAQPQFFVVPSAPTVQVQPLVVQQVQPVVVQPVVQKVVQQRVVVQQQRVVQPRTRSLTIQRIRTR